MACARVCVCVCAGDNGASRTSTTRVNVPGGTGGTSSISFTNDEPVDARLSTRTNRPGGTGGASSFALSDEPEVRAGRPKARTRALGCLTAAALSRFPRAPCSVLRATTALWPPPMPRTLALAATTSVSPLYVAGRDAHSTRCALADPMVRFGLQPQSRGRATAAAATTSHFSVGGDDPAGPAQAATRKAAVAADANKSHFNVSGERTGSSPAVRTLRHGLQDPSDRRSSRVARARLCLYSPTPSRASASRATTATSRTGA